MGYLTKNCRHLPSIRPPTSSPGIPAPVIRIYVFVRVRMCVAVRIRLPLDLSCSFRCRTNENGACLWLAVASAHRLLKILSSSPFLPERAAILYLSTMSSPLIHDFLFSAASLWAVLRGGLFPVTKPVPFFGSGPDTDALSCDLCVDVN